MIPRKHIDLQSLVSAKKFAKKISDLIREAIRLLIDQHSGAAVEIPAKNYDRLLSAFRCCTKGSKVRGSIDEKRGTPNLFDSPTGLSRLENRNMPCGHLNLNGHG
jgi:Arc/MetJ-type ribon-helix-helix transcriptional regulator